MQELKGASRGCDAYEKLCCALSQAACFSAKQGGWPGLRGKQLATALCAAHSAMLTPSPKPQPASVVFLLGKHTEAMARLEAELDAAGLLMTPERPQPRALTYADISKLPWLDACVKARTAAACTLPACGGLAPPLQPCCADVSQELAVYGMMQHVVAVQQRRAFCCRERLSNSAS